MSSSTRPPLPRPGTLASNTGLRAVALALLLYVFMLGVNGLSGGFRLLGSGLLDSFFSVTTNPFLGLIIGLLTTSLVQSSSVTTSLIVGLVAAPENPLPIANAVPMIMGANIGTTVTNTLVSLGHVTRPDEFRRAFAVATCHDFFNFMAVLILLPVEIATGYLRHCAETVSTAATGLEGADYESPVSAAIHFGAKPIQAAIGWLSGSAHTQGIILIALSGVMIYFSLLLLVQNARVMLRSRMETAVSQALEKAPLVAMAVGMIVTALIQSSSITTSLLVPLAGAGVITLAQAFPVTIGANVGTTITALLASMAVTGENAHFGVVIALTHLLFNISATVIIYPIKAIRRIPLMAAQMLANTATKNRWAALAYVGVLFYVLPMALAALFH